MRNWLVRIIEKIIAHEQSEMIDINREKDEWKNIHDSSTKAMLGQEAMNQYAIRLKMIKHKTKKVKTLNKIKILLED